MLGAAHIGAATGGFLLDLAHAAGEIGGRDAQCLHPVGIQLDSHLPGDAANPVHGPYAADAQQSLGDVVIHIPGEGFIIHALRGDGIGEDGCPGQIGFADHRIAHITGQIGANAAHRIAHIIQRFLGWLLQTKLHRDGGCPVGDLGIDMFDPLQ